MGFLLEEEGVVKPSHPHIVCAGGPELEGRGWAWHDDLRCQLCYSGTEVAAPAPMVSAAMNGQELTGIDRLLAAAVLKQEIGMAIWRIFQKVCPVCGKDHRERVDRSCRIMKYIHPDAVPFLREARVPESHIRTPRQIKKGSRAADLELEEQAKKLGPKELKVFRRNQTRRNKSIPVCIGDPDRTRAAQIAFAIKHATDHGIALPPSLRQTPCSTPLP